MILLGYFTCRLLRDEGSLEVQVISRFFLNRAKTSGSGNQEQVSEVEDQLKRQVKVKGRIRLREL